MRFAGFALAVMLVAKLSQGVEETKFNPRDVDKQLYDVLKEIHNRGADLFNAGDAAGCYRLYQGTLRTTRAVLAHRPQDQKYIDDVLAEADKLEAIAQRAFMLHEAIEKLRNRLRLPPLKKETAPPEILTTPPREQKQKSAAPKIKIVAPKDGVIGRIFWQGKPLAGVAATFVSRGARLISVYETASDNDGRYILEKVRPGKYTVLLTKADRKPLLPERYATATVSPLIVDVKGGGDTLDFMLQ